MTDDRELIEMLESAMRAAPPVRSVELETQQGTEMLFSPADKRAPAGGPLVGGGVMFIPADTPENRRRARVTYGCPVCPDVNQGLIHRDVEGDGGVYVIAAYAECGHEVMARLDQDAEPLVLGGSVES